MATTSPDNLRTPDPGDPYNLVPDLATLAGDVQTALDNRGNAFKGTASQRTAFTATATDGMLWQDTDGIKMIWRKDGSSWVPAVWRWSGSGSQMNNFTQAPDGFKWYNTTDNSDYERIGGAWTAPVWQKGLKTYGSNVTAGNSASTTVTFPTAFTEVPVLGALSCTSTGTQVAFWPRSLTTAGFVIQMRNFGSGSSTPGDFQWSAFGPVA